MMQIAMTTATLRPFVRLATFCLLAATFGGSGFGCSGTTKGGSEYKIKVNRELEAQVSADLATTHATALDVLENELFYMISHEAVDALEGIIEARSAVDRKVKFQSYFVDETTSKVTIAVTPFGYQPIQRIILDRVQARLGGEDDEAGEQASK